MDPLSQLQHFQFGIRRSFFLVVLVALFLASIADLLSIVSVGELISWSIPPVVWFIARRTTGILKTHEEIADADAAVRRQFSLERQRAASAGLPQPRPLNTRPIERPSPSYTATFLRDTTATHLIELIPIVDALPFYLGQVLKSLYDQQRAARKARAALQSYETTLVALLEAQAVTFSEPTPPPARTRRTLKQQPVVGDQRVADIRTPEYAYGS